MNVPLVTRALGLLGLGTVLVLAGMWAGHGMATTQADAARAKAAEAALQNYQAAVAEGEAAVTAVHEQLRLQKSYSATLDERQRHAVPLIAPVQSPLICGARIHPANGQAGLAAGHAGPGAGTGSGAAAARALRDGVGAEGGGEVAGRPGAPAAEDGGLQADALAHAPDSLSLSLAAVSLWNSALAGHDVPAGACRADATAEPACAAAAGTTLDDAWANHRANAASCAADRARYQGLIDYLQQRAQR